MKKLIMLIVSILFVIATLIFFISSIEIYNDGSGWKGLETDRDYLFLFISSIFILIISILNYINRTKYNKEIKQCGFICIGFNILYSLYGIIKVISKGIEEIYDGNAFVINVENLIIYIVWFVMATIAILIIHIINKRSSLVR